MEGGVIVVFTVPGKPQPKQRARLGKGGRWYTPTETRRYERLVRHCAGWACAKDHPGALFPAEGAWEVTLRIYLPDRRPRDVDNVAKAILDGCNRVLWGDDRQVRKVTAERFLDPASPRVEVEAVTA
jgi:Holliday junction resolvase RusA-like endonuclease